MTDIGGDTLDALRTMALQAWYGLIARTPYLLAGLVALLLCIAMGRLVRQAIWTAGDRTRLDVALAQVLGRLAASASTLIGTLVAAVIIFPTFRPGDLIAGLGIASIAVGFAFKDILQNMLAGLLILYRKPFRIGDQIRTAAFAGTVETINVRATVLRSFDDERIVIPNSDVYTRAVTVLTALERRRLTVTVGVGYGDSLTAARETILAVVQRTEGVLPSPAPWVYLTELAPSAVVFTVYLWARPDQANVLAVADRVTSGIKLALDAAGIDMPYPHRVVRLESSADPDRPAV